MSAPTKTAPKPAAPQAKENPAPEAQAPEVAPATVPEPRKGNAAAADKEIRAQVADLLEKLRDEQGLTRPFVIAHIGPDANGRAWNDSMVWRAFNRKIHTVEVDSMTAFLAKIAKGELKVDTGRARKPKLDDVQARVTEAIEVLSNEAKTAAQYRKIVEAAVEMLRDVVPAPEAPAEAPAEEKTDAEAPTQA